MRAGRAALLQAAPRARPAAGRAKVAIQAVAAAPPAPTDGGDSGGGAVKRILANVRGHLMHESGRQVVRRDSSVPHEMLQKNFFTEGATNGRGGPCKKFVWDR